MPRADKNVNILYLIFLSNPQYPVQKVALQEELDIIFSRAQLL